jgi:hypothetical protein
VDEGMNATALLFPPPVLRGRAREGVWRNGE